MPTFKITVPEVHWSRVANELDILSERVGGEVEEIGEGAECNTLIDEQEARDADVPPHCGDLVEINGFEYVVAQECIDGSLELRLRDDLQDDDEDNFFSLH